MLSRIIVGVIILALIFWPLQQIEEELGMREKLISFSIDESKRQGISKSKIPEAYKSIYPPPMIG